MCRLRFVIGQPFTNGVENKMMVKNKINVVKL